LSNSNVNLEQQIGEKPMGMMSEFKTFAMRGNVIDLAVGVIIGAAFGKIVDSVVNDLIMPWWAASWANWIFPTCSSCWRIRRRASRKRWMP
jgi:hypothetical protein